MRMTWAHTENTSRSGGADGVGTTACSPQQGSPLPWEGHKEEAAGVCLTGTSQGTCGSWGCPGSSLPFSTATQAWGPRPVPSPRAAGAGPQHSTKRCWSPELLFVVWLGAQPAQNCQHWGPALPTAMRSMQSQGWQSRHTAPFTAQGSACALGLNDPQCSVAVADSLLTVAAHHSLPISAFLCPSFTLCPMHRDLLAQHSCPPCPLSSPPLCCAHLPSHQSCAFLWGCGLTLSLSAQGWPISPSHLNTLRVPGAQSGTGLQFGRAQARGEEDEHLSVWAGKSPDPAANQGCIEGPKGSTLRRWPGRSWVALLAFISLVADNTHRATHGKETVYTECPYKYFQCTFYTQVTETFHSSVQSLEVPAFS